MDTVPRLLFVKIVFLEDLSTILGRLIYQLFLQIPVGHFVNCDGAQRVYMAGKLERERETNRMKERCTDRD